MSPAEPTSTVPAFGAFSEVGRLRRVLVCAPGLAHERLTPSNAAASLIRKFGTNGILSPHLRILYAI